MATNDEVIDVTKILTVLSNEEEFIIKPLQSEAANDVGATECGKIVSKMNKVLFDYQIGDKTNTAIISSVFNQRILLKLPGTTQVVLEFYQSRLPLLCRTCCSQEVHCLTSTTTAEDRQSVGSIRQGYVEIKSTLFTSKKKRR